MSADFWEYDFVAASLTPGFYPVLVCWDPTEGFIPTGGNWNGKEWLDFLPVALVNTTRCETWREARELACKHDPGW